MYEGCYNGVNVRVPQRIVQNETILVSSNNVFPLLRINNKRIKSDNNNKEELYRIGHLL